MVLSAELENMKGTNIKFTKVFKSKVSQKCNTNKHFNQKGNKKKSSKQKNGDKYTCENVFPNKDKMR